MESINLDELYEKRLLVFLENEDEPGFSQVILDPKQFKKISDIICEPSDFQPDDLRKNFNIVEVNLGDKIINEETFLGMTSFEK